MKPFKQRYLLGVATVALLLPAMTAGTKADPSLDAVLQRLDKLEKENAKLKSEISKIETKTSKPVQVKVVPAKADGKAAPNAGNSGFVEVSFPKGVYGGTATLAEPVSYQGGKDGGEEDDWWIHHKPGSNLTFVTPNGEVTAYGRLNMTIQDTNPGIAGMVCTPPSCGVPNPAIGSLGWLPSVGSSNSYVGIRGYQNLGDIPAKFVYQLESSIEIESIAGTAETNSKFSNTVAGSLTSRNSYIGFSTEWGSIKAGKTTAPYANTTAMMNPFAGMLGNYNVIMGNTGGDNRAEFNTRLEHAIWYESPNMRIANGTFSFQALVSPGQNRGDNNDDIPMGMSDCSGGNAPNSGGFSTCSDGSFGDAYSAAATYQTSIPLGGGGLKDSGSAIGVLVTAAYEFHSKVNRSSDVLGMYGAAPDPLSGMITSATLPGAGGVIGAPGYALNLYNQDVADEDAWKVGAQIKLPTHTTVSGIFESMHRYVPQDLEFQNERQRNGTWFAVSQDFAEKHNVSFGWGHAFRTPGDPCQHNDCILSFTDPDGNSLAYAPNHNAADMLTLAYSWKFYPGFTWFIDYAATINESSAHYDLAQGGGAATTDCHDGSSAIGGNGAQAPAPNYSNPHCWTGGLLQGIQSGVRWNF